MYLCSYLQVQLSADADTAVIATMWWQKLTLLSCALARTLSSFLPPLLQLSASPIYNVRVMASKALVAMTAPSEYMSILSKLIVQLPSSQEPCCHNRLHGQLLQIRAVLERALCCLRWDLTFITPPDTSILLKPFCVPIPSAPSSDLKELLSRMDASLWLVTEAQHCPLVRAAYLGIAATLRKFFCETYLAKLNQILMCDLQNPPKELQVCDNHNGMTIFWKVEKIQFALVNTMQIECWMHEKLRFNSQNITFDL